MVCALLLVALTIYPGSVSFALYFRFGNSRVGNCFHLGRFTSPYYPVNQNLSEIESISTTGRFKW